MSRRLRDAGSVTVEMALVGPAAVIMIMVMMALGQVNLAMLATDSAAFEAARAASIARSETAAVQAKNAAKATLRDQGIKCDPIVDVNTDGFRRPVGQPAVVSVTVTCALKFSDLFAVFPDSDIGEFVTLKSSFISPLDTYRGRT